MKAKFCASFVLLLAIATLFSCKKDDPAPPSPTSSFTASASEVTVGQEIQFTNTSENASTYAWSFGNGNTSTEESPKQKYTAAGMYEVTLVATGNGESASSSKTIKVLALAPTSSFTASATEVNVGQEIQFTNTSQNAATYAWTFGNGNTSTETSPKQTYTAAGTYTVTLAATGPGGSASSTKTITVAAAPNPKIFLIDSSDGFIRSFNSDGTGDLNDIKDVNGFAGVGLAYDAVHGKIYFSDYSVYGEGKIWQMNVDGTELTAIVSDLSDPYGIALDVEGGKIYWAEDADASDNAHIGRANLNGTSPENIVTIVGNGYGFRAVALDLENDKIYYYDVNNEVISRANLDGTDQVDVISGDYGYALFIDTENDKLYFDQERDDRLARVDLADLDGVSPGSVAVEVVDDLDSRMYGIAIDYDNDVLYWSSRDEGEIYKAALDGSGKVAIKTGLTSPRAIFFKE